MVAELQAALPELQRDRQELRRSVSVAAQRFTSERRRHSYVSPSAGVAGPVTRHLHVKIMRSAVRAVVSAVVLLGSAACATTSSGRTGLSAAAIAAAARPIHERVMTLDTHVDIDPRNFVAGELNYAQRLNTQVDLTKMEQGGLDAVFFSIYVGQGPLDSTGYASAYAQDTAKFNAVHRLAEQIAPTRIAIAYTADDARRIYASGRKVAFLGVENGYGIGPDITRVKEFHDRGARYMSLSHNGHSQLSDSNTGEATNEWMWRGLSPLGRQAIAEMNRWGIMIDVSHPSKESMMQTLALTKAPIIASHSAARALCNHSRNLDDEQLRALARNGGVVQMVAFRSYVKCDPATEAARARATAALNQEFGIVPPTRGAGAGRGGAGGVGAARRPVAGAPGAACSAPAAGGRAGLAAAADSQVAALSPERRQRYQEQARAIAERYPQAAGATVGDFVDHIDHAAKLIGIDHVGISSDFDGGGGVDGFNCALESINVTTELLRRGYTEEEIAKIWSGNLLRVLGEVERTAKRIQAGELRS
jgi:membrane dipeptidase